MRHTIWKKGDYIKLIDRPRYDMVGDGITAEREELAVVLGFSLGSSSPFGKAVDIRVEDGEVTAEIVWVDPVHCGDDTLKEQNLRLAGTYIPKEWNEDKTLITRSVLHYVSVSPISDVPNEEE